MKKLLILALLIVGCEESTKAPVCTDGLTIVDGVCQLCDIEYSELDSLCYYQSDLYVLQNIIDVNENLSEELLEMGSQEWSNGRLTSLYLEDYAIKTIPETIVNLSKLEELSFRFNEITNLPENIGNLSSLKYLSLGYNQLASIPESIGNISSLTYLGLSYNQLTSIPDSIGDLSALEELYLSNNQLSELPISFGNLSNLCCLNLWYNQFSSIPESLCILTGLNYVQLQYNSICDGLPPCLTVIDIGDVEMGEQECP